MEGQERQVLHHYVRKRQRKEERRRGERRGEEKRVMEDGGGRAPHSWTNLEQGRTMVEGQRWKEGGPPAAGSSDSLLLRGSTLTDSSDD